MSYLSWTAVPIIGLLRYDAQPQLYIPSLLSHDCEMSASQTMKSQPYYLLLIQSSTGKLSDILLPVPETLDPVTFVKAILAAYNLEVSKARRLYYRCVLGKRPAVSVVTLAKVCTLASLKVLKLLRVAEEFC